MTATTEKPDHRAYALFNSHDFLAGNLFEAINSVALTASQ
jgi:hypothetical protein